MTHGPETPVVTKATAREMEGHCGADSAQVGAANLLQTDLLPKLWLDRQRLEVDCTIQGRIMTRCDEFEIINSQVELGRFRVALFDFDGTLSLIRAGWQHVMIPMMVNELRQTNTNEPVDELAAIVDDFVNRLTGKQTIFQMIQLADEIRRRGGEPRDPLEYKHQYHGLLLSRIQSRLDDLAMGRVVSDQWLVPGSRLLLTELQKRGVVLFLASGTDLNFVRREASLLGIDHFFEPHIYGALDDYWKFSKKMVVQNILQQHSLHGEELLGFGDGFVEIEEIKRVGGVAIGVASDEENRAGIDSWKRKRLIEAGADIIIPDYHECGRLCNYLWPSNSAS